MLEVPSSREKHKTDTSQTLPDSHMVLLLQTRGLDRNLESSKVLTAPKDCEARADCKAQAGKTWENESVVWPMLLLQTHRALPHQSVLQHLPWLGDKLLLQKPSLDTWYIPVQTLLLQSREEHCPDSSGEHGGQHRASLSATATEDPAPIPAVPSHLKDVTHGPPAKISTKLLITTPGTKATSSRQCY